MSAGTSPRVVCVIQARMGSTRLPGKSLEDLGGKPLVQHVIERTQLATRLSAIVLATTRRPEDRELIELARRCGVGTFTGSEGDLVDRYFHAAIENDADMVVRIPADNPLIHGSEVDRIVKYFMETSVDFASNLQHLWDNGYPDGIGAEVFAMSTLAWLHREIHESRHREHVTTYFLAHPERFRMGSCQCPPEFRRPEIKLDVNTRRDLEYLRRLFADTATTPQPLQMPAIIRWYDAVGRYCERD